LILVIPAYSALLGALFLSGRDLVSVVAKWFVFWGMGMRLLMAPFAKLRSHTSLLKAFSASPNQTYN
jgi:hypothetical protein